MSHSIFKYPFQQGGSVNLSMPDGATILDVQVQHGTLCAWALVNPSRPEKNRSFLIFGTGHRIPDDLIPKMTFVKTFQLDGGQFVFHMFEIRE